MRRTEDAKITDGQLAEKKYQRVYTIGCLATKHDATAVRSEGFVCSQL